MASDTLLVFDRDGDERRIDGDVAAAWERKGYLVTCPNDEDDEAAGYHAHIHTDWETRDAWTPEAPVYDGDDPTPLCPKCRKELTQMWADDGEAGAADWWECDGCHAHGPVPDVEDPTHTQNGIPI